MQFRSRPPAAVRLVLPLVAATALVSGCSAERPPGGSGSEAPTTQQGSPAATPSATPSATAPAGSADTGGAPATPGTTGGSAPATATPTVTIEDFRYDVPDSVPAGSAITVVNEDREAHTVTFRGGTTTTVPGGGARTTVTAPDEPGTYQVLCDFHGGMTAQLTVTAA